MKKLFLALIVLLALAIGGFYWYTKSGEVLKEPAPVITEPQRAIQPLLDKEEMKKSETVTAKAVERKGSFTEIDFIHKGSGLALVYPETAEGPILRLQDFSVTRGPDLYVYLSKNANITSADQLGEFSNLGTLKSSKGDQNYPLPANHDQYQSVVIWCQAFGVLFSSATLEP